ncbi:hypothetical protein DP187_23915 [Enterobacter cloacae]|nr:hypothetical protein DP187_23915 [Enterobacter cloacae]
MEKHVYSALAPSYQVFLFAGRQELNTLCPIYIRTEQRVNGIPSVSLELSVPGNAQRELSINKEMELCQVGLPMSIKVYDDELCLQVELFSGVITARSLTIVKGQAILSLVLKHNLVQLDNVVRSQVFNQMSCGDIIRSLCPADVSKVNNQTSMDTIYEQRVQFRCSDWRMLRHCLDACGAWLIASPSMVHIFHPRLAPETQAVHHLQAENGPFIEKASWNFTAIDQPASLRLTAWDIASQTQISALARKCSLGSGALEPGTGLSDEPWVLGYGTSPSMEELRSQAESMLLNLHLQGVKGEFTVQGSLKYQPGNTLKLSGFGQHFDGVGIITAVIHTITPSRWITTLTLGPGGHALTPKPFLQMSGIHTAVVSSYDKSDKLYRIRVHLNALGDDQNKNQLWARFAMPYATKGSSFICYPEPGDEVAVGFFEDNPDYPVIVGSLHNPKSPPAIEPGKDEGLKGWKTDELQLQIDTRKQNLMLKAGDKSTISLDKSQAIEVKGDNGININGKQSVTIKGNKIDLSK